MDFAWSDEQLALKEAARDFAATQLDQKTRTRENLDGFSLKNWRQCARFGILGMPFPKAYGGADCDLLTAVLAMEGLGYGCRDNGLLFALNAQMWSVQHLILLAGTPAQKDRYLPTCIDYARTRRQFNQPIGRFQSVSNRIADMKVRLETARLLLYQVAWTRQQGRHATLEAAMAKLYLSEAFLQSSMDAIRTFGGYGYLPEYGVEGDVRDAIGGTLYSGTSDIQRNIIASQLGVLR